MDTDDGHEAIVFFGGQAQGQVNKHYLTKFHTHSIILCCRLQALLRYTTMTMTLGTTSKEMV